MGGEWKMVKNKYILLIQEFIALSVEPPISPEIGTDVEHVPMKTSHTSSLMLEERSEKETVLSGSSGSFDTQILPTSRSKDKVSSAYVLDIPKWCSVHTYTCNISEMQ